MFGSRQLIPSTSMLLAFEAAARLGSFTAAGDELNLTQGAVSRQIRALEEQLGVQLFARVGREVRISAEGEFYAQQTGTALRMIRDASLNIISDPKSGNLNLAILPTFAMRWLMPRFPTFIEAYPRITVNFVSKLSKFDFNAENIHAAIHYGEADWAGANCTFLMGEEAVPVAAPSLLKHSPNVATEEIANLPLLHLKTRPHAWKDWFQQNSCNVPTREETVFEEFAIVIQAAVAGVGAALLPRFLVEPELEKNDLVILADKPLKSNRNYYLVSPTNRANYSPLETFRSWLLKQVK